MDEGRWRAAAAAARRLFHDQAEACVSGRGLATMLMVVLAGCAPAAGPGAGDEALLIPSLDVKVEADSVRMTLHVLSAASAPLVLEFASSQRADFWVRDASGETVWMWSAARSFAQVTGQETVAPGGSLAFSGVWTPARAGRYEAVARLVSTNRPVQIAVAAEVR